MSLNDCVFRCVRCTKWIPVLFLVGIMCWAYYAYVYELCVMNIDEYAKKIVYIFLFHFFLIMFLWSYGMTIFTKPAFPTDEFYLEQTDIYQLETAQNDTATKMIIEKKAKQLPILTRTNTLQARYCDKCKCIKPDRAHHCGTCQQCVLKMDHHCPWVNNCVGHSNYKYFILFLSYAFILCLYIAVTSFEYFIEFWNEIKNFKPGRFHLLFLFFVSTMFAISVFSLLAYHIYLVARNSTTLESFRAPVFQVTGLPDSNGFNLGIGENFRQIFGRNFFLALLPIKSSKTDGINFKNQTRMELDIEQIENEHNNSKITIIGSGWGQSSTIIADHREPLSYELPRNSEIIMNYYQNQSRLDLKNNNNSVLFDRLSDSAKNKNSSHGSNEKKSTSIESDNSLDYDELLHSLGEEHKQSSKASLDNSISFNNINTILKKNPNITIKTVVEHYEDFTKKSDSLNIQQTE